MESNKEYLEKAITLISSTLDKCEKMQAKFAEGTSQHSLLKNRIKALRISKALLTDDKTRNYTSDELRQALVPVLSIINKTRKAQDKYEKGSSNYNRFEPLIKAMVIAKGLIEDQIFNNIELINPHPGLKSQYLNMIWEWKESGEELIPWSLNLDSRDFNLFLKSLNDYSQGRGLPEGFVPCTVLWLVSRDEDRVLGAIDIRHELNAYLSFRGGHIGYGIRPGERNKGYAGRMLSLALDYCKRMGLKRVLVTCLKSNIGSAKTIIKNGGILDSEDRDMGQLFQRYWINIK